MIGTRMIAIGVALVSGTAIAQAQSVVSRQIGMAPVETTITQGPNGTVVTRRPLDLYYRNAVTGRYYRAPGYYAQPFGTVAVRPLVAPPTVVIEEETVAVRRTPTRVNRPRAAARTVQRNGRPPILARAVEPNPRAARVRRVSTRPLALQPAQREIIYRTIVREQVYAPAYFANAYYANAYAVGAVFPRAVALAPVPQAVAVQVPATNGYRYAVVSNRVLLVEPATGIVVANVTP